MNYDLIRKIRHYPGNPRALSAKCLLACCKIRVYLLALIRYGVADLKKMEREYTYG